jgi:hypothetical protein
VFHTPASSLALAVPNLVCDPPRDPLFEHCGPDSPEWIACVESVSADVLLVWHTHLLFVQEGRGRTVANPGNLGQPKNGSPEACCAIWDGTRIELKTFPYPHEKTIARRAALGLRSDVLNDLATVLRTGGKLKARSIKRAYRNGVPLLPRRPNGPVVAAEPVNRLRDEDE